MSLLKDWAMKQINRLGITTEVEKRYEKVLDIFCEQDHSGSSAGYMLRYLKLYQEKGYEEAMVWLGKTFEGSDEDEMQALIVNEVTEITKGLQDFSKNDAQNLIRLLAWKPIFPLTGEESEWSDNLSTDRPTQQNLLCSAVFRDYGDNSTARYIDGRVFSDNGGHTWFMRNRKDGIVQSSMPISFPFWVPDEPEYIYLDGEDSSVVITDSARIKELYDAWARNIKEGE